MSRFTATYKGASRMPVVAPESGATLTASLGPVVRKPNGDFIVMGIPTVQRAITVRPGQWKVFPRKTYELLTPSTLIQGWHDPTAGMIAELNATYNGTAPAGQGFRLQGGVYDSQGNAYFVADKFYNVTGLNNASICKVDSSGVRTGPWFAGSYHALRTDALIGHSDTGALYVGHWQEKTAGTAGPSCYQLDFDSNVPAYGQQPASEKMVWPLPDDRLKWTPTPFDSSVAHWINGEGSFDKYWSNDWGVGGMCVVGTDLIYLVQRPVEHWYGNGITNGDHPMAVARGINIRGNQTPMRLTAFWVFPNVLTTGERDWYEVPITHHMYDVIGRSTVSFVPTATGADAYVLEANADRTTDGPVLHWFKLAKT